MLCFVLSLFFSFPCFFFFFFDPFGQVVFTGILSSNCGRKSDGWRKRERGTTFLDTRPTQTHISCWFFWPGLNGTWEKQLWKSHDNRMLELLAASGWNVTRGRTKGDPWDAEAFACLMFEFLFLGLCFVFWSCFVLVGAFPRSSSLFVSPLSCLFFFFAVLVWQSSFVLLFCSFLFFYYWAARERKDAAVSAFRPEKQRRDGKRSRKKRKIPPPAWFSRLSRPRILPFLTGCLFHFPSFFSDWLTLSLFSTRKKGRRRMPSSHAPQQKPPTTKKKR